MKTLSRRVRQWSWNVLVATDEWLNALTGGDPDATISLRLAQAKGAGRLWGRIGCRVLDFLRPGHCAGVLDGEEAREPS
ncbi:MAG TPA: hypothetical protein VFC53_06825 [Dehalococcoidia bacterium]|jgi:hypothetical protein|nr:hypothetical protein [Dehalococcoidia bacterium]